MASIEKRIGTNGKATHRAKIRIKGSPDISATFDRRTDAKEWANKTEAEIKAGRYNINISRNRLMSEALDRYIKDVLPIKSNKQNICKTQLSQLLWWREELGSYMLTEVSSSIIAEKRDKLAKTVTVRKKRMSNATVNRYMAALSHVFTTSYKEWEWISENPMVRVKKMKEPRGRMRFLEQPEITKLLDACKAGDNKYLYPMVGLAIMTGARKGELANLTWNDIKFDKKQILVSETKNDVPRTLPISEKIKTLLELLLSFKRNDSNLVFPNNRGTGPVDIKDAFSKAKLEAGIEDFTFHDTRHTAASHLAANGASLYELKEFLGHKTLNMVARYAHLTKGHTQSIVEKMNDGLII